MRIVTAQEIDTAVTFRDLIETLRRAYRSNLIAPLRSTLTIARPDSPDARLNLMPAWSDFVRQGHVDRGYIGLSVTTVVPQPNQGEPTAKTADSTQTGVYLLLSGKDGIPIALIDGPRLTEWRAAAVSALAASYLSREHACRLLILGSGPRSGLMIEALAAVRSIRQVLLFGAPPDSVQRLSARFTKQYGYTGPSLSISTTNDLEGAVKGADIICRLPTAGDNTVLPFDWLQPGCHIDLGEGLLGDGALLHEARAFAESRESTSVIAPEDLAADLPDLAMGQKAGRRYYDQITAFAAEPRGLADLACAGHIFLRT